MTGVAIPGSDGTAAAPPRHVRVLLADASAQSRGAVRSLLAGFERYTAAVHEVASIQDLERVSAAESFDVILIEDGLATDVSVDRLAEGADGDRVIIVLGDTDRSGDGAAHALAADYLVRGETLSAARLERTIAAGLRRAADRRALAEHARRLTSAQALAGVGSWEFDIARGAITWSAQLFRNFGLDPAAEAPSFEGYAALLHPDDRARVLGIIEHAIATGEAYRLDHRVVWPDGQVRTLHCTGEVLQDADGRPTMLCGTAQLARAATDPDTTAHQRFRVAFDEAPVGMALIALDGSFLEVNQVLCRLASRTRETLLDDTLASVVHDDDAAETQEHLARLVAGDTDQCVFEARLIGPGEAVMWAHVAAARFAADSEDEPLVLIHVVDLAARREREQHLRDLAERDPLTGILNRRAWDARLTRASARAQAEGDTVTVALLDLNAFKTLNDRHGHEAGDRLLQASAGAWLTALRSTDTLARLGGDEFAVLLEHGDAAIAEKVVERLRAVTPHEAGCAIGVAIWDGRETPEDLLRRADEALYADKSGAKRAQLTEPDRVAAVHATGLFGAPAATELDRITDLAAWLLSAPVSFVSLLTADQLHFAGHTGLPPVIDEHPTVPIEFSFCQHTVTAGRTLQIPDARLDRLVADNPLVEHMSVIAYAGIPLTTSDGHILGALCAVDHKPRDWTPQEIATLELLAERAVGCLQPESDSPVLEAATA